MAINEDQARWEKNLKFFILSVDVEDNHRHDFNIMCNGKCLVVTVDIEKSQDEILEIIYETGWRKFAALAPEVESGQAISLHSDVNPETFYFRLDIIGNHMDVIQEPTPPSRYDPYLTLGVTPDLPTFSAREILFTENLLGTGYIAKVTVNGRDMCCKMLARSQAKAVQREYACLKEIAESKHASSIRVPKLLGFVVGDNDKESTGVLEEYIPHTMTFGGPTEGIKTISIERRRKWGKQVKRNVDLLHEIGVIWGDGKPHNVLVNSDTDDCFLIDFGGSWTDGWVDAKLAETRAGDKQALTRILKFLGI